MRNVNVRVDFRGTKKNFVVFLHWPPRSMPMSQDDEDRFRPRLGRIRSDARGGVATKSFFTRVRKIARQHGAGLPGASAYRKSGGAGGPARGEGGARRGGRRRRGAAPPPPPPPGRPGGGTPPTQRPRPPAPDTPGPP